MNRMWPEPAIQPGGSDYCQWYAVSYLANLLGKEAPWEAVRQWREESRRTAAAYLPDVLALTPSWRWWSDGKYVDSFISYSHQAGFRKWIEAYLDYGCVGYGVIHLRPDYGHAVVVLSYDEDGVLMADSVRGLVRDSWDVFTAPARHGNPSYIEAWFKLPKREGVQTAWSSTQMVESSVHLLS